MTDNKKCSGCTACVHVCPVKCIEMKEDTEGFLYPIADSAKCINCRKCEAVCPIENAINVGNRATAFIGYSTNQAVREQSSSGGIFSVVAEWILSQGGVVFGAAFDENFEVCHIAAEDEESLAKLRGSKYVQSRLKDAYPRVLQYLENGRLVLFTGTACQIAGLKNYLNGDYENLYTVDVLCHGVPSPKIWKMYLEHIKKQYNSSIEKIEFRNKQCGWKNYSVNMEFSDKKQYCVKFFKDKFMQMFLGNIDLRPSCYDCRFKDFPRVSDMTIGDSWGVDKYMPDMDDDRGTSIIIPNCEKGRQMLAAIGDSLNIKEANLDVALPKTAESRKSVMMHPNRNKFLDGLKNGDDINALHKFLKKNLIQRGVAFLGYCIARLKKH